MMKTNRIDATKGKLMEREEADKPFVVGTCLLMCPTKELIMREREGLLHTLETADKFLQKCTSNRVCLKADPKKAVKCYQRSAAGRDLQSLSCLRPPSVLKMTVKYLLAEVIMDRRVPWISVYHFISDRLRAVKQDLIVQQPDAMDIIAILEPTVRFYVYAAYRLIGSPLGDFDPVLNNNQLTECLKYLLALYDDVEDSNSLARPQMEALYQIVNIGDTEALLRGISLPDFISTNYEFRLSLEISLAWYKHHYVTVFKSCKKLSPLLLAAIAIKFPSIRRYSLEVMSSAYSSKNIHYPLSNLKSLLLFGSEEAAEENCLYYNVRVNERKVCFQKGVFDSSKTSLAVEKLEFITEALESNDVQQILMFQINNEE